MNVEERIQRRLGPKGLERIEEAVRRAEAGSSGEIAVYVAWRSDSYPEAPWLAAALAGAGACLALFVADLRSPLWTPLHQLVTAVLAAAGAGALAGRFVPAIRRLLAGRSRIDAMVRRRAEEVFLCRELFKTQRRTGILLFVSLFERRAVVVADSGISAKVGQSEWDRVVAHVTDNARSGALVDGIVKAVERCRGLLLQNGFLAGPGDRNELSDRPMIDEGKGQ